ncbi:MAG: hypothetical protein ACD_4C00053G0001, partial [uncultured bacterium (gcode 4)]
MKKLSLELYKQVVSVNTKQKMSKSDLLYIIYLKLIYSTALALTIRAIICVPIWALKTHTLKRTIHYFEGYQDAHEIYYLKRSQMPWISIITRYDNFEILAMETNISSLKTVVTYQVSHKLYSETKNWYSVDFEGYNDEILTFYFHDDLVEVSNLSKFKYFGSRDTVYYLV